MKSDLHPIVSFLRDSFNESADPEDAAAMQAYMKSEIPFYGIRSSDRKKMISEAFKSFPIKSYREFTIVAEQLWNGSFREEKYAAIAILKRYRKFHSMELLSLLTMMIKTGAWWDFVDEISAHLVGALLQKYPAQMKKILCEWIDDENIWIRRSAILAQLRFKQNTDAEMLFGFCTKCLEEKDFWIRKAIGWALREYSKSNRQAVSNFVDENKSVMSGLTLKEASKYL